MTAEIAIMNKEAVAIAADSAVTFKGERGQKIFQSANKIFCLSKYHPVGIMIYGNANFMGVPWESIVKIYRNELEKREFPHLCDYARDFRKWLIRPKLFPSEEQESYVKGCIYSYFAYIRDVICNAVENLFEADREIRDEEIKAIAKEKITEIHETWKQCKPLPSIPRGFESKIKKRYLSVIKKAKKDVFEKLSLDLSTTRKLTEIAINLFLKCPNQFGYSGRSGIVIAGFGAKDIFPSIQCLEIEGIVEDVLKYWEKGNATIDFHKRAAIVPFAQSEMVATFMEGVDPGYEMELEKVFEKIITTFGEVLQNYQNKIAKLTKKTSEKIEFSILTQNILEQLNKYRKENFVNPITQVVSILPKNELAAMAESLVNLTSFKRRISLDMETVCEPIDVAVISKGDGFIWIKRKHYFEPELNPHFFTNYFREYENE